MSTALAPAARPCCYTCLRPLAGCVCARVPRVANRTPVYILQHPRERRHPFGSARFARLGLATVSVDVYGDAFEHLRAWSPRPPAGTALLYPGRGARDLASLPAAERPQALLVVDGTWSQARHLIKTEAWLAALPQVKLTPPTPGLYRIRREPALHCMSTIEAVVSALRVLEPETRGLDELLAAFVALVDAHLELRATGVPERFRRTRRGARPRRWGTPLARGLDGLVLVYAELLRRPPCTQLVYWTALRPRDGASFAAYLRPGTRVPDPFHLDRMGLSRDALAAGVTPEELRAAWRAFAPPGEAAAAWNQSTLEVLRDVLDDAGRPTVLLKALYCNRTRRPPGELADLVAAHGLAAPRAPFAGRAGERMGQVLAIARELAALATGGASTLA